MPASYTITKINWSSPPAVMQVCSVYHKLSADPDSAYVLDSASVQVQVNGTLVVPYVVTGLAFDTSYTIKMTNNCGGEGATIVIETPNDPCPDITGITGTVSLG